MIQHNVLHVCVCMCACVQSDLKPKEKTDMLKQVHKCLKMESLILFPINGRTLEKWVTELTGWIQDITSQFFHLVCCVCLIRNQWDLQLQEVNPCLLLSSLLCGSVTEIPTNVSGLLWRSLFLFFPFITLPLKHWFITKTNYLVSNFCIVGRGNNWKWTPGLWTPRDQWENNSVSSASQRQWRGSSSETLISSVWPESGAFRARRTRTF